MRKNRILLDKMRNANMSILEYSNKIIENNAQERLYILTKNCGLDNNRSTPWKYMPNLDFIFKISFIEINEKKDYYLFNNLNKKNFLSSF